MRESPSQRTSFSEQCAESREHRRDSDDDDICILKVSSSDIVDRAIEDSDIATFACRVFESTEGITAQGFSDEVNVGEILTVPGQIVAAMDHQLLLPTALAITRGMRGGPVYGSDRKS